MKSWQTIITAAGEDEGSFQEGGFKLPKNLIPFKSTTILGAAIGSYGCSGENTHVVIRGEEAKFWKTNEVLLIDYPNVSFHMIPRATRGALCSAAMALDDLDANLPLIVASGDSVITGELESLFPRFLEEDCVAGTLLFESTLPRWSYARLSATSQILEMAEKVPISPFASTGLFYFKSAELFMRATEWVLKENMHTKGAFYISSALNYLIMNGENVFGVKLQPDIEYVPLSTFHDLYIAGTRHDASI
jgi:hypothetical protein